MTSGRIRILVGLDFSPESGRALRAARALRRKSGGILTLAHVRPTSAVRAAVVEEQGDLLRGSPRRLSSEIQKYYEQRRRSPVPVLVAR